METYTVINSFSGDVIDSGLSAEMAAHVVLTDDGGEYEVREDERGGWSLWTRKQVANRGWSRTLVGSAESDRDAAEADIWLQVIRADWPRHPTVMTDASYQAENE